MKPKRKRTKKPIEIDLEFQTLEDIVNQCSGADEFNGVEGTVHLEIKKVNGEYCITKASMDYPPEPEPATINIVLNN